MEGGRAGRARMESQFLHYTEIYSADVRLYSGSCRSGAGEGIPGALPGGGMSSLGTVSDTSGAVVGATLSSAAPMLPGLDASAGIYPLTTTLRSAYSSNSNQVYTLREQMLTVDSHPGDRGASPAVYGVEELPVCTVCLRRMVSSVTGIPGVSDFPIDPAFIGNQHRCAVCEIYGNVQSQNRRCNMCAMELRENLWTCLTCGHTGCGRYTYQHAKLHSERRRDHCYSMELATGRIWSYSSGERVWVLCIYVSTNLMCAHGYIFA